MISNLGPSLNSVYDFMQKIKHKWFSNLIVVENRRKSTKIEILFDLKFEQKFRERKIKLSEFSKAQLGQDILALMINGEPPKYFVEFGATNGIDLSNTYLLEVGHGWNGILVEPGIEWQSSLTKNRKKSKIDFRAVWTDSNQTLLFEQNGERGSLVKDGKVSQIESSYMVQTVSLSDLLTHHGAPTEIDYLSIDIEGHEDKIIMSGVLDKYSFKLITLEHNYKFRRYIILRYMRNAGYCRIFSNTSLWDDWYIRKDLLIEWLGV